MRQISFIAMVSTALATTPCHAFDAAGADILGLRLRMTEPDVTARLMRQGAAISKITGGCSGDQSCLTTLRATTRDGELLIHLTGAAGASQIQYVFRGHGADEPAKIKTAIIDRFGAPDQPKPMAWCRKLNGAGLCAPSEASLTFVPETLTIILQTGDPERR